MTDSFRLLICAMGVGRILLGLAPFVAAAPASRLLGFPREHDTATARLMGRLFGVRDIGLGVLAFHATRHPETAGFLVLFNAAMDAGDLVSVAIPLARREGIDRGALRTGACALVGGLSWIAVWFLLGAP
jgi:hypothetical protein